MRTLCEVIYTSQDIFDTHSYAIVNPVNLVGVSGKGLALEYRHRYPHAYEHYKQACISGELNEQSLIAYMPTPQEQSLAKCTSSMIIYFPTKKHFKDRSSYTLISQGLKALCRLVDINRVPEIAIPPLGCGLGKLDVFKVYDLIHEEFIRQVGKSLQRCYLCRFTLKS